MSKNLTSPKKSQLKPQSIQTILKTLWSSNLENDSIIRMESQTEQCKMN